MTAKAQEVIRSLSLQPHPEGGWYREIYRSPTRVGALKGQRSALTTIYYLLERSQVGRWHVVDADEVWHFYGGSPLELLAYEPLSADLKRHVLSNPAAGFGPAGGEREREPVAVIGSGVWQASRSLGDFSLVGCSVAPGFDFADFRFVSDLADHGPHFERGLKQWRALL